MAQFTNRSALRYSLTYGSDIRVHVPRRLTLSADAAPALDRGSARFLLATVARLGSLLARRKRRIGAARPHGAPLLARARYNGLGIPHARRG